MAFLANNQYFTMSGHATMRGCGDLAELQKGGQERGSMSATLPQPSVWLAWAHEILGMSSGAPPPT